MGNNKYIKYRLKQLKMLPLEMECKLLNIVKGVEGNYETLIKNYFSQFEQMIWDYKSLSEMPQDSFNDSAEILLNISIEGLIKLILFSYNPIEYLKINKKQRTLGNINKRLLKLIEDKDKNKKELLKEILEMVRELRNNFIHFSFYSQTDYRFEYIYFQTIAYLIDSFKYWDKLSNDVSNYIKEKATSIPDGVDLLEGFKLYEEN